MKKGLMGNIAWLQGMALQARIKTQAGTNQEGMCIF